MARLRNSLRNGVLVLGLLWASSGSSQSTPELSAEPSQKPAAEIRVAEVGATAATPMVKSVIPDLPPDPSDPPAAEVHLAAARAIAESDMAPVANGMYCMSPARSMKWVKENISLTETYPPSRAFDDLFYIGKKFVGSWVLKTSDGLIVFDTLNNEREVREILLPGLATFGLDPKQIRYVIITHSHPDHFGGAKYLQDTYKVRVMMGTADWQASLLAMRTAEQGSPPRRDMDIADGQTLTLGDKTVRFIHTPGHTPGAISSIIPVTEDGRSHYVTMWATAGMPSTTPGMLVYQNSFHKLWAAGRAAGAEGVISTHAWASDTFGRFDRKKSEKTNPFLLGTTGYERFMGIYDECILAQLARYTAWRK